jgi:D-glycero-D-manno-heptose 1,7-bisphosphate phosphatase
VDVGYMIVSRDKFFSNRLVQESIHSNLSTIIEKFSEIGLVSAVQIKGEYLSISDPERLEITREFLKFKKIILLDRDGIINVKMGTGKYVTDYADFIFIQDHISVLEYLSNLGYSFIVITNQACINLGKVTIENLNLIHESMIAELNRKGINIIDIYLSPDHWKNKSGTRKPNPDLFFMASKFHSLWLEQTIYIGDEIRDVIASKNAGCGVVFIDKQFNSHLIEEKDVPAVNKFDSNLGACTNFILEHYSKWESIL